MPSALRSCAEPTKVIGQCRKLLGYFKRSSHAMFHLKAHQFEFGVRRGLESFGKTRFATVGRSAASILRNIEPIKAIVRADNLLTTDKVLVLIYPGVCQYADALFRSERPPTAFFGTRPWLARLSLSCASSSLLSHRLPSLSSVSSRHTRRLPTSTSSGSRPWQLLPISLPITTISSCRHLSSRTSAPF